ncbi:hypothetical protein LZ30DRAFT_785830 [Colletotrichum cereale]|nr:hypothetical protein LZ30DRAFT_785830 [Colletotrichum cereale]
MKPPTETSDSHQTVFNIIIQTIAAETGVDLAELTDDTVLADIGIDFIMYVEIASKVFEASGLDLAQSFLVENAIIGDLRRQFAITPASNPSPKSDDASEENSWDRCPETSLSFREKPWFINFKRRSYASVDAAAAVVEVPRKGPRSVEAQLTSEVDDSSPLPTVKLTLLQGVAVPKAPTQNDYGPFT